MEVYREFFTLSSVHNCDIFFCNAGFNPVWDETLELHIKVAPVSLVYFSVRDESSMARDAVLALACIPFRSLQTGMWVLSCYIFSEYIVFNTEILEVYKNFDNTRVIFSLLVVV